MSISDLTNQFAGYIHRLNDKDVTQRCGLQYSTTNANALQTTNDIVFRINNQYVTFPAISTMPITTCSVQGISSFCYYIVSLNSALTVTTTKGIDNTLALPTTPANNVTIGGFLIVTDASHTFQAGIIPPTPSTGIAVSYFDKDTGMAAQLINQAMARLERGVTVIYNKRQRTIQDFTYMISRAQVQVNQGDTSVILPFIGYKDFKEITITDSVGVTSPMKKEDLMPLGVQIQMRPVRIARMPSVQTVFTNDGIPALEFDIWPIADQTYTIDAICYEYSQPLDGILYTNNWLTDNAPDVLLFGGLVEAKSYFPADARMDEWEKRYNEAIWTMYTSQSKESYTGDYIRTKFPNPLNKRTSGLGMSTSGAGIYSYGFIDEK